METRGLKKSLVLAASLAALSSCESPYTFEIAKPSKAPQRAPLGTIPAAPAILPPVVTSAAPAPAPSPDPVICDAFGGSGTGSSKNGLAGQLYYLDPGNPAGYTSTDQYIQYGHTMPKVGFVFSQLDIPTYDFSRGFQLPNGNLLTDTSGNVLNSYFGFHFRTSITLTANESPGLYQFAMLSDDGSSMRIENPNGTLSSVIEAEGNYAVTMNCASAPVAFDSTTQLPVEINWHQGPPVQIAMVMMWRKVDGSAASLQDNYCGVSDTGGPNSKIYFNPTTVPSTPLQGWYDLQAHGWNVVAPANFLMPAGQTNTCGK